MIKTLIDIIKIVIWTYVAIFVACVILAIYASNNPKYNRDLRDAPTVSTTEESSTVASHEGVFERSE